MQLTQQGEAYILECTKAQGRIAKSLGFTWWTIVKDHWATKNHFTAARLYEYADEETRKNIKALFDVQHANFLASSCALPVGEKLNACPKGRELRTFQEASVQHMKKVME